MAERAPTWHLYVPKLVTILRAGYGLDDLRRDLMAGLTVSIVALPLSMALAIASGASPAVGLHTAIVAGFLISMLGGSRVQVGGPTAAFIPVVFGVIAKYGYDGLVVATLMAAVMLILAGLMRLGTLVRYMPQPVITGFTAGIAVSIFSSQIKDLFGLDIATLPAEFFERWHSYFSHAGNDAVQTAGGNRCFALRSDPARVAAAAPAVVRSGAPARAVAQRIHDRLSGRSGVVAVGGGLRRHDRRASPIQLRTGGAGRGERRLGADWWSAGHRRDRAYRHQCARRRSFTGGGHGACGVHPDLHGGGRAAGQSGAAAGDGSPAGDRGLEHERDRAHPPVDALADGRPSGADRDVRADRDRRSDRGGAGRRGDGVVPVHVPHERNLRAGVPRWTGQARRGRF